MKTLVSVLFILITFTSVHAQSDSLKINAGVVFSPQAYISLKDPSAGFQTLTPVIFVASFTKGNVTVVPQYNLSANALALLVAYDITPKFGMYVIGMKNVLTNGGYVGAALTTPVAQGRGIMFAEVGTSTSIWEPILSMGVIIPLKFKVR